VGLAYQRMRDSNVRLVNWMTHLSGVLAICLVAQTVGWIGNLIR
jgi:hypothetical protein